MLLTAVLCALFVMIMPPREAAHGATASYKKRLRVMSYNIHVGIGMDKKLDLARIAEVIRRERPVLVGLQEVDRGVQRTQRRDEIAELARLTKMEYAFAPNLDFQGGQYGVAILSRHPILALDHRRFQHLREAERRGFIRVQINVGGKRIHFVTTHLDYQHADNRLYETQQLLRALGDLAGPVIVAGDFNDEPSGSSYKLMLSAFVDAWSGEDKESLTFPADKPVKRIDYIFIKRDAGVNAKDARVVATQASDHLPLVVDLEID
jgi:endonuclease/exonuclease/phosphatase family metal-dependent hydrolase